MGEAVKMITEFFTPHDTVRLLAGRRADGTGRPTAQLVAPWGGTSCPLG
ncbi:hypothetical protein [Dactylosporangium cerinum]